MSDRFVKRQKTGTRTLSFDEDDEPTTHLNPPPSLQRNLIRIVERVGTSADTPTSKAIVQKIIHKIEEFDFKTIESQKALARSLALGNVERDDIRGNMQDPAH